MARRGRLRPEGVALAWARDRDGTITPVRALDEASRRARAPFTCPGCGDELVARLGAVRARHFAHRPGSTCPLTAPETALHFNAKERLLALCDEAFAGAREVTLLTRCPSCRRLDARPLRELGDAAATEGAIGALRADVLVTRRWAPAAALEVLVTHAVDAAKEAVLLAAAVPMVEIDAREEWERERASTEAGSPSTPAPRLRSGRYARGERRRCSCCWQMSGSGSGKPLPVEVVVHRALGFPSCPTCRAAARAEADRALGGEAGQIAELEAYRARGLLEVTTRGRRRADGGGRVGGDGTRGLLSVSEVAGLRSRFRCPDCGLDSLLVGARLVSHPCAGQGERPVAWRGYDGRLAELRWWKR